MVGFSIVGLLAGVFLAEGAMPENGDAQMVFAVELGRRVVPDLLLVSNRWRFRSIFWIERLCTRVSNPTNVTDVDQLEPVDHPQLYVDQL